MDGRVGEKLEGVHIMTTPTSGPRFPLGYLCEARYENYKGETEVRRFIPLEIYWGSTEYHSEMQWLLRAWDRDRGAERDFALAGFVTEVES